MKKLKTLAFLAFCAVLAWAVLSGVFLTLGAPAEFAAFCAALIIAAVVVVGGGGWGMLWR